MHKARKILVILLVVVLLAGAAGVFVNHQLNQQKSEVFTSREREYIVSRGDITAGFKGTGKLSLNPVDHNFEIPVRLCEIYVRPGQKVNTGDPLATISEKFLKDKLKEAESHWRDVRWSGDKDLKEEAQAAIDQIKALQEDPVLYAKVDGIVSAVNGNVYAETALETPIVVVGEQKKVKATVGAEQTDVINVQEGQNVVLEIAPYPDQKLSGKVSFITLSPQQSGGSTSYPIIIDLEPSDLELLDGMSASATFVIKEVKDVLMLSNKAVLLKDGKQFVQVKDAEGVKQEREILTGFSDGKNTEILKGLSEGDKVYVGG